MTRMLILFYSTYGHVYRMAKAMAEGAKKVAGMEVHLRRVKETLPEEVLAKMGAVEAQQQFKDVEILEDTQELAEYDCIMIGVPTRYGGIPAQMQTVIDATGGLWMTGALVGKVGGAFCCTGSQHGGNEITLGCIHTMMMHQGMLITGLPYSFKGMMGTDEVAGGTPYGATTIAAVDGFRLPSQVELDGAAFQGEHAAKIAHKLFA